MLRSAFRIAYLLLLAGGLVAFALLFAFEFVLLFFIIFHGAI